MEMLGNYSLISIVMIIVSIIVSLTIHEFMHAFVGHKLGDTTAFEAGRVSFNPLQHIDPFMTIILPIITVIVFGVPVLAAKPVPFNPERLKFDEFGSAMVAAAGPLSNLVLAVIASLLLHGATGGTTVDFLNTFMILNVAVFVFNLIPIPPLDGSRVLYAFAPDAVRNFFDTIEPYGIMIVFALVLLGGLGGALGNVQQAVLNVLP
jgi:Zn-dependent protease